MTIALLSGTFSGTGRSSSVSIKDGFNLSLSGFGSATVAIERSFDNGATWKTIEAYTADAEKRGCEPEDGVLYSLNCSAYSSGSISYRVSK